ncbi:MAG: hypothetical protein WCS65_12440 [Verrucomicrobiae bacterium]
MTLAEASKRSGYAVWTLQKLAREGKFLACKPRGNRGGWEVNRATFEEWIKSRILGSANGFKR